MTRAKEMVYTGDFIDARTAFVIGLLNRVVPQADLMNEARELAKKLLGKSSIALALAKNAINTGANLDLSSALDFEEQCFAQCFATEDQKEGMAAFAEKRKAEWKGK